MAKTYTKQERDERYERLPQVLKEALFSADIAEKMFALGKKYGLTMEKIGFMSEEAGFVVLGLTPPRVFTSALAERLGVPADTAEKIALEISHEIFFPLREALKQTHQIDVGEGAVVTREDLGTKKPETSQLKPTPAPVPPSPPPVIPPTPVSPPPQTSKPIPTPPAPSAGGSSPMPQALKPILPSPTILSAEVKPPPIPASLQKSESAKTQDAPKIEQPKKTPPAVRAITEHLEKEIAPIMSTIRNSGPAGFLSREETEKLVAEKQAEETGIKKFTPTPNFGVGAGELGIMDGESVPVPAPLGPAEPIMPLTQSPEEIKIAPPSLTPQRNSIDLRGSTNPSATPPPPPLAPPTNPKIPHIDLRAVPPKEASPAPEKTKPYQGYDPYREPIE